MKLINLKLIVILLCMLTIVSCNNDDSASTGQPPIITSVSATLDEDGNVIPLEPINIGFANNTYVIQGSGFSTLQKVYFNDFDTYFNPNFVTETSIFITINRNTPYSNVSNKLKLVTKNGVVEYDFIVAPPSPELMSFNPINALDGDIITLFGNFFINPVVTIGGVEAEIVSSSMNQVQVIVPANSLYKFVRVSTVSGFSSAPQALGTAIYDDEAAPFVENYLGPWDGSGFVVNTENKVQGNSSIQASFSSFTGFKFPMYATPVSTSPYKGIRVSFRSTKESGKFKVVLNNNYDAGLVVSFNSNNWTTFEILFSQIGGTPSSINELVFQEFNNDGGDTLYIDDVGFILND